MAMARASGKIRVCKSVVLSWRRVAAEGGLCGEDNAAAPGWQEL
jgi:hypothetical protein